MFEQALGLADTPALAVHWPTVQRNVSRMAELARQRDLTLRPHIKTHKLLPLARLQMQAGAVGVTVAKLGEAEVMLRGGISDILIAYPIVGRAKVSRLLDLVAEADVSVAVDSYPVAAAIAAEAARRRLRVPALVEVDTGLHRCGGAPGLATVELARQFAELPGLEVVGILTHEGHAYATPSVEELRRATRRAAQDMFATAQQLAGAGLPPKVVSMGSSATASAGMGRPGITEFRPGTYVFNDRTQVALGAAGREDCAAGVIATVVSRTTTGEAVVDAGSKALTFDRMIVASPPESYGEVIGHPDWQLVRLSEEHGVLRGPSNRELGIGDRVVITPNHICPVVNLFDSVLVVDDAQVTAWPVDARGRSQ